MGIFHYNNVQRRRDFHVLYISFIPNRRCRILRTLMCNITYTEIEPHDAADVSRLYVVAAAAAAVNGLAGPENLSAILCVILMYKHAHNSEANNTKIIIILQLSTEHITSKHASNVSSSM